MRSIKKLFKICFYFLILIAIVITPNQNVLIDDGVVLNISPENIRPTDKLTIIIEGKDRFLIPALWDMTSQSSKYAPYFEHLLNITHGVTHLRDFSGCLSKKDNYWACTDDRKKWTRLAEDGKQIGPSYHHNSTHPIADGSEIPEKFPDYLKADRVEKADALVKFAKSQDADFLAVNGKLSRKVYFDLSTAAQKNELYIAGDLPHDASLPDAISAGQKSIDSASVFALECYSNAKELRNSTASKFDSDIVADIINKQEETKCNTLMTAMASSQTWWTPNLSSLEAMSKRLKNEDKYKPLVNQYFIDTFFTEKKSNENFSAYQDLLDLNEKYVSKAWLAGVKILAGSNAYTANLTPGLSLHNELEIMVDGGRLTPLQSLQAASTNAAIFSDLSDKYGSIAIGAEADFILLNSNPLENIRNTKDINAVITHKRYFDKEALEELTQYVEKQTKSWHQNVKILWASFSSPIKRYTLLKKFEKKSKEE